MWLYNIFIEAYVLGIRISALSNKKAKEWLLGRKNVFADLANKISSSDKVIWFHCSSAGELEQGLPVIERMQQTFPQHKILISFFSPSGMNAARKLPQQYILTYLPKDTKTNAAKFIELVHPQMVVFVKYEFWYHHLQAAAFRHIPILLVSAVFRKNQLFFQPYGKFYRQILFSFRHIFVQDEQSKQLLLDNSIPHCSISGDTRFDRVHHIAERFTEIKFIGDFLQHAEALVAGSTWPDDEKLLADFLKLGGVLKLIIAPHEINEQHLTQIENIFPQSIRYSQINNAVEAMTSNVLIVDSIGLLSRLYQYATIAYVGGGFTKDGIHNILEAAVYGKPVFFGTNYKKYREAVELLKAGGAFSIADARGLKKIADELLNNATHRQSVGTISKNYIEQNIGASEKILRFIQEKRLLTS